VLRKGFGRYLDVRHSGVEHRMAGRGRSRQGDGVDGPGSLEGIEWVGIRERRDPVAGLDRGPVRDTPAEAPVLGSDAVAPGVGAAEGTAGRTLEQALVGHSHLTVSLERHPAYLCLHC
jgi:hypothetical protein